MIKSRNCNYCGKEYTPGGVKYCSKACQHKSMMKRHHFICPVCGFEDYVSENKKYCSLKCACVARKQQHVPIMITEICPYCNKQFEHDIRYKQTFCSRECANHGRSYSGTYNMTIEGRAKKVQVMHDNMVNNQEFRAKVIDRMKNNNPTKNPEVVAKIKQKMQGKYTNNFRYGNGKISEYEKKVYDKLEPLGFAYNHAIPTGHIRLQFPEKHYPTNYKPDFVNFVERLCIEVDGCSHSSTKEVALDHKKEECLRLLGFTVIRFTHLQIDNGEFDKWLNSYQKSI